MKRKADALIAEWKADKLWGSLSLCWLATVFSSLFGPYLFRVTVPGLGTMYAFRFLLPVTAVLYIFWAVRERENPWKDAPAVEKWVYGLIVILILYGAASLPRALDFMYTFQRLFNLCLDLCLFYLMLRLCRNSTLRRRTMELLAFMLALHCVIGLLEVFMVFPNGFVNSAYAGNTSFYFFNETLQWPIVFSSNVNDYLALLVFLFASLLLTVCSPEAEDGRKYDPWTLLFASAIYFLTTGTTGRLSRAALLVILAGVVARHLLLNRPHGPRNAALIILCCLCLHFSIQYRFIVPPIQRYVSEMAEYRQELATAQPDPESPDAPLAETPAPPTLTLGDPKKQTLKEEFFTTNEETGEQELRDSGSGGIRARLLIHAFRCFGESYGFGVGLGNTETLAARRAVVPAWKDYPQNSIHCFVARLIADYGVFALIPFCAVGLLLLKKLFLSLRAAIARKDRTAAGYGVLFFFVMLAYPFVSTASSDAQDSLSMWIYLASIVLFSEYLEVNREEEIQHA